MSGDRPKPACPPLMGADASEVRRLLEGKSNRLLMLDYDGTLAPFREERDKAVPYPGVRKALAGLMQERTVRLVIISGRAVDDLIPLLGLDPPPEIWGSHGWERRFPNGEYRVGPFEESALQGLANADDWAGLRGLESRCEKKPGSVALHWRGLDPGSIRRMREAAHQGWAPLARKHGLEVKTFDGGIEIRMPGRNKGDAVLALLSESAPDTAAAYLGDDRTDEDAFEAMEQRGLAVLVRTEPRESCADLWIRPPEGLLGFLDVWRTSNGDK